MDQSLDAKRIHLGNICNGKKETQEFFKRYYFTVANVHAHITYHGVALPDISSSTRVIFRLRNFTEKQSGILVTNLFQFVCMYSRGMALPWKMVCSAFYTFHFVARGQFYVLLHVLSCFPTCVPIQTRRGVLYTITHVLQLWPQYLCWRHIQYERKFAH